MTQEITYRLSVAPGLEAFRPELEYACDFLDQAHFVRRVEQAPVVLHYGPNAPSGAIAVPAALFPHGVRIEPDGIHPDRDALTAMERDPSALPLFFAPHQASSSVLDYDALGLIFFALSRIEERGAPHRDRYNRFSPQESVIVRRQWMLDPPADRAAADLAAALTGQPSPPCRSQYEIYLTHDVDILGGYHWPIEPLKWAAGDILKRGAPLAGLSRLYYGYFAGEPWTSIRSLMDASEHYGAQSHFYFMGPSVLSMDSPYVVRRPELLKRVVKEIAERGHEIGFHPGFGTAMNAEKWLAQREGLERVIGRPVREGRQHTLQYDAELTPDIWSDAGMTFDCTLSYPEEVGFRAGTCRTFRAYSLRKRRTLPLTQSSTAIMEFGLFGGKYHDMPVERALALSLQAADICRRYGGRLTILYHSFNRRQPQWGFYNTLLSRIFPEKAAQ